MDTDLQQDPEVVALGQRCALALQGFVTLNSVRGQEEGEYYPPNTWGLAGQIQALISLLIGKEILEERDVLIEVLTQQARLLENSLGESVEHKRKTTGVIVPGLFPLNGGRG